MPTYDFRCSKCENLDEHFYKMSEVPQYLICSKCGAKSTRQIDSGGGIIFKGPGFYCNDYKKGHHSQ